MVYFIFYDVLAFRVEIGCISNALSFSLSRGRYALIRVYFGAQRPELHRITFHDVQERPFVRFIS